MPSLLSSLLHVDMSRLVGPCFNVYLYKVKSSRKQKEGGCEFACLPALARQRQHLKHYLDDPVLRQAPQTGNNLNIQKEIQSNSQVCH